MKSDFNNSRYAKFFDSKNNRDYLQTFVNTKGLIGVNYGWWRTQCQKDAAPTPTDASGLATFTQKSRALKSAILMDMRAPLGKGLQEDVEGIEFYQASIPHFISKAFVENSAERLRKMQEFEEFGNDRDIVIAWTLGLQEKLDSAHQTLNYMTGKLMTTAKIDSSGIGMGIQMPIHKANVPKENFKTAGTLVWTDPSCAILSQMAEIEKSFRDEWGFDGALVWKITYNMFYTTFLQNKEVKELVESYKKNPLAWVATTSTAPTTADLFQRAIMDYPGISPIEIVVEKERNMTNSGSAIVQGWDDKYAVLCPAGKPCDLKWTNEIDQKLFGEGFGANDIEKVFAKANDGICTIVNSVANAGELRTWRTEVLMSAVPALNEFMQHVIVDTSTADS